MQNIQFCLYLHSRKRDRHTANSKQEKYQCESSSVGRARPCQGRGREFESRLSLKAFPLKERLYFEDQKAVKRHDHHAQMVELVDTQDLKSCSRKRSAGSIPALSTEAEVKRFKKPLNQ